MRSLAILAVLTTAACSVVDSVYTGTRAEDLRDAGSVHLSVLAVAPWSEYVAAMQPNFQLTADGALARVAADSRWATEDRSSIAQLGQQALALDRASNGARPLEVPALRPPGTNGEVNGHGNGAPAPIPPPASPGQESATGPDAMLRYTAATALFQEVQLLNRYIRDAAIPNGYRPYLVRVQVSLMPSRRHAPYDTYTTLSFFIPGDLRAPAPVEPAAGEVQADTTEPVFREPFGNGPKVLPLLVTDNLEAGIQSRSFERIRSLIYSWVEFPGDTVVQEMVTGLLHGALREQVLGRDLNSLLTVARLSENTLRIRIGAVQEATANYAMVPRNHNITLLLMVPEGSPPLMELAARTELVDAETGAALGSPKEDWTKEILERLSREERLGSLEPEAVRQLVDLAERNDQRGFAALLHERLPEGHPALGRERELWIQFVTLLDGSKLGSHFFELPGQGDDVANSGEVFRNQTVVVQDDGVQSRVVLREARFPGFEHILATLSAPGIEPPILLPSRAVEVDPGRRECRASFASISRLQLLSPAPDQKLKLTLSYGGESCSFDALYRQVQSVDPDPSSAAQPAGQ